jgi:hypothetical protein
VILLRHLDDGDDDDDDDDDDAMMSKQTLSCGEWEPAKERKQWN